MLFSGISSVYDKDVNEAYGLFADEKSKELFSQILRLRAEGETDYSFLMSDGEQYVDNIINPGKEHSCNKQI